MDKPEWRLSHWCLELCDRIILVDGPAWWTAIETGEPLLKHGSEEEKKNARFAMQANRDYRGIKPHALDVWVYQHPWLSMHELKVASSEAEAIRLLRPGQKNTMFALTRNKMPNFVAWSIPVFYEQLLSVGFRLHGNHANIAREIEQRYLAKQNEADLKKAVPVKKKSRSRKVQPRYLWK
jgi:hypothetical protein